MARRALLLTVCCYAAIAGAAALRARRTSSDEPEMYTPPVEYGLHLDNHKTMYLADITVGSDSRQFRVLVDTGSSMLILPSPACTEVACAQHARLSDHQKSSHAISIGFAKGSVEGHVWKEAVCLSSPGLTESLQEASFLQRSSTSLRVGLGMSCANMSVVAVDRESHYLAEAPYDGILGLGLPDAGDVTFSFLDQLHAASNMPMSFALQLSNDGDSKLVLGPVDAGSITREALFVPLSPSSGGYWQFQALDLSINGIPANIGSLEILIDSGTSLIDAEDGLKVWLQKRLTPENCDAVGSLPWLGLQLSDGVSIPILPSDYVDRVDRECALALMPDKFAGVNGQRLVLGDSFLRRYTVIFDRTRRRLGFGINRGDEDRHLLEQAMFPTAPAATQAATSSAVLATRTGETVENSPSDDDASATWPAALTGSGEDIDLAARHASKSSDDLPADATQSSTAEPENRDDVSKNDASNPSVMALSPLPLSLHVGKVAGAPESSAAAEEEEEEDTESKMSAIWHGDSAATSWSSTPLKQDASDSADGPNASNAAGDTESKMSAIWDEDSKAMSLSSSPSKQEVGDLVVASKFTARDGSKSVIPERGSDASVADQDVSAEPSSSTDGFAKQEDSLDVSRRFTSPAEGRDSSAASEGEVDVDAVYNNYRWKADQFPVAEFDKSDGRRGLRTLWLNS